MVLGLASSGVHSNGYSLARKVVFEIARLEGGRRMSRSWARRVGAGVVAADADLRPPGAQGAGAITRSRTSSTASPTSPAAGCCENLDRIVPEGVQVVIDRGSWPVPPVFPWLQRLGEIDQAEMEQVFNLGVGMVLVVSPFYAESIRHQLADQGIPSWVIGRTAAGAEERGLGRLRGFETTSWANLSFHRP